MTEVARAIVAFLPTEVADTVSSTLRQTPLDQGSGFAAAFFADQTPAQAETLRQVIRILRERADDLP